MRLPALLSLLATAACSLARGALGEHDLSVGALSVGDDSLRVRQVLGSPRNSTVRVNPHNAAVTGEHWLNYGDLTVVLAPTGIVRGFVVSGDSLRTARGLRVGDDSLRVASLYGDTADRTLSGRLWLYSNRRAQVGVELDTLGRVARILLTQP